MSAQQMRAAIYEVYPGRKWKEKVLNMDDAQVIAVYYSFLEKGKFDKNISGPVDKPPGNLITTKPYIGEQMKIDI